LAEFKLIVAIIATVAGVAMQLLMLLLSCSLFRKRLLSKEQVVASQEGLK